MYVVHPMAGEQFYLRVLLTDIPGATSFEALRTTRDGVLCNTFREAAALRGLLADDSEWHKALEEVATYASGKQLRELFAYILLFCDIGSPLDLWTKFREELADDFRHAAG